MLEPFWVYFNSVRVTVLDGCYSHEANWNCISGYSGVFLLTGCCQSFDNDGAGGRKETEMVVKLTAASIMAIFNP